MRKKLSVTLGLLLVACAPVALADTCVGTCGTLGANGVVTLSPYGSSSYNYVTTAGGASGGGQISGIGGTNGSSFTSSPFAAAAGAQLKFYFNYVTSDGSGFADYSWAELLTDANVHTAWLFTARTQPSGNTSPGFGLPANDSTLAPPTTAIIPGGPAWSPLGGYSGQCFSGGCGYTGWIQSTYSIGTAGNYVLKFGVTNWSDAIWDSGLAFDGATIGGTPVIGSVPEPSALVLFGTVMGALVLARRRRKA
jgi:hypothetical protein